MTRTISSDFPFESRFIEVRGSKIHYIDEGSGEPILFLHGNPTSSYLWRNIIPHLVPHARCIAPDLIGMGRSEKPDLDYRFFDHYPYVEGFIDQLGLSGITLVVHDWGSGLGFHYAMRHSENIRGIAFMEALVKPMKWKHFPAEFRVGFKLFRTPGVGWLLISVMNVFVKKLLPQAIVRDLSAEEMRRYAAPYPTINSRKPVRQWPCEIPIDGTPVDVHNVITDYSRWLQESPLPKLLFYASPGGIIDSKTLEWCREHFNNLETVDLGEGIHYLQEDHPHEIGEKLAIWYRKL